MKISKLLYYTNSEITEIRQNYINLMKSKMENSKYNFEGSYDTLEEDFNKMIIKLNENPNVYYSSFLILEDDITQMISNCYLLNNNYFQIYGNDINDLNIDYIPELDINNTNYEIS